MQHAILRTRASKVWGFRVCWTKIEYACRESNGSLKPVPVGTTRKQLYCGQCMAKKCLLTGKTTVSFEEQRRRARAKKARQQQIHRQRRIRDLASLPQTCWNCCELRIKLGGYVCRHEPEAEPVNMHRLIHRYAQECQGFGWRLEVEIPPLNGDGADCDPL